MRHYAIGRTDSKVFSLPHDAVTQKIAMLGRTGSGKSYVAMKLAEALAHAGAQFFVIDPVGVWWGLRLAEDGHEPGIDIPVFGGLRGDIPLVPTSGALMADLIVDRRLSVILDVSQFETDRDKARFVSAFGDRFFRRMKAGPAPVHGFLEEAQEFIPQNPNKGEEMMLHHWTRAAKLGRNFGIGLTLISQRPQEVNKKVLNMTELLFAFQMTGIQERKTIREWLGTKGSEQDGDKVTDLLRELPVGTARVSSPQWLKFEGVVSIDQRWTYNSSSTPDFTTDSSPIILDPLDLGELQEAMAATVKEAEANDPKKLRARIVQLERAIEKGHEQAATTSGDEIRVARNEAYELGHADGVRDGRQQAIAEMSGARRRFENAMEDVLAQASSSLAAAVGREIEATFTGIVAAPPPPPRSPSKPKSRQVAQPAPVRRPAPHVDYSRVTKSADLTGPQRKILNALAWLEAIGVTAPSVEAVAFIAGYRPGGGAYNNPRGTLRTLGLVDYPAAGTVALTAEGRAHAEPPEFIGTLDGLHDLVMSKLSGPEQKILQPLLESYPEPMAIADLAVASGYANGGGAFNNPRGRLRTLGLIDYPRTGFAVACDLLFPEALR